MLSGIATLLSAIAAVLSGIAALLSAIASVLSGIDIVLYACHAMPLVFIRLWRTEEKIFTIFSISVRLVFWGARYHLSFRYWLNDRGFCFFEKERGSLGNSCI